jgi:hypothetical protein
MKSKGGRPPGSRDKDPRQRRQHNHIYMTERDKKLRRAASKREAIEHPPPMVSWLTRQRLMAGR